MGLRTMARVGTMLLVLLSLIGAAVAGVLTTRLARTAANVEQGLETLRAGEQVRVAVLNYAVESNIAFASKTPEDHRARVERELALANRLAEARAAVPRGSSHSDLIDEAELRIRDFMAARRAAEQNSTSPSDVITASAPEFRTAVASAQRVVDAVASDLELVSERARTWGRVGVDVVIASWIGIVLAFALVLAALYRYVLGPILGLTDSMRAYARGDRDARARLGGSLEIDELAGTFNALVDQQARHDRDRLTFLAGVAHDLRNPLAAMRVATQFLRPGRELPPEPQLRATIAMLDRQVTRLERMVGDILDASRIEGGHLALELEHHDLRKLAEEAVQLYRATAEDSNHVLSLEVSDESAPVRCDPERIAQVLNNLVSNALKYSPAGGPVTVAVKREDEEAVVSVADRGLGIAGNERDAIFEPFRRAGASRETIPGVGLGLSVSRRIVESHRGRLEVESTLGVGSTFTVRLPLSTPRANEVAAAMH